MNANFSDLNGVHIQEVTSLEIGSDCVTFVTSVGNFQMYHSQDCCESVSIVDIVGDVADLNDATVLFADEVDGEAPEDEHVYESSTWTFYNIQTNKGHVQIRWLGVSNGYYSESVSFCKLSGDNDEDELTKRWG